MIAIRIAVKSDRAVTLTDFTRDWHIGALVVTMGLTTAAPAANLELNLPVACELGRTCFIQNYVDTDPSSAASDYRCGTLTYDDHNGTDFRLPSMEAQRRGVDVLAAADGRVLRVRNDVADVSIRGNDRKSVSGRECGNGVVIAHADGWETQYCHMQRGSVQVRPGQEVTSGQTLGRVGLSGLTEYPHLHLTVRHGGKTVDPFAYGATAGACRGGEMLWAASLRERLAYQERTILNAGFAADKLTMAAIENGDAGRTPPTADSPALVAFVRTIGLKAGDVQSLHLRSPSGQELAKNRLAPLDRNKAQNFLFVGKRRPPAGWDRGTYQATYQVEQNGRVVLQKELQFNLQ
jgi:hypothetical protein